MDAAQEGSFQKNYGGRGAAIRAKTLRPHLAICMDARGGTATSRKLIFSRVSSGSFLPELSFLLEWYCLFDEDIFNDYFKELFVLKTTSTRRAHEYYR